MATRLVATSFGRRTLALCRNVRSVTRLMQSAATSRGPLCVLSSTRMDGEGCNRKKEVNLHESQRQRSKASSTTEGNFLENNVTC